jgi:hypothetical protein
MDVWALDGLNQIGPITTFTKVQIIERDLGLGAWVLEMPLGEAAGIAARLMAATWPGIEVYDPDTGWRFGGYLTDAIPAVDDQGVETVRLVGSDFQADLGAWLEWPGSDTPIHWWYNSVGGTIPLTSDAHTMVYANAGVGASAEHAQIAGLVQGPDPAGGAPKARRIRGEPLLDVLRFLFLGEAWTARLRLVRDTAGAGSVLFETPARTLAPTVLDVKRGSFGRAEVRSSAAKASHVIAMGGPIVGGLPGERMVRQIRPQENNWRYRHRELFINRPATDDSGALLNEAADAFSANNFATSVRVEGARVEGYGLTIDLGQMVTVQLGPTFTPSSVRLPVAASTLEFTPEAGWKRTVDLGGETLSGLPGVYATIARLSARARKLEGEL